MSEPTKPSPRTLADAFKARITATLNTREALNPELMQRARDAEARGDHAKAVYWAKKARRLNTESGVKQLIRGGTARDVASRNTAQAIEAAKQADLAQREYDQEAADDRALEAAFNE